MKNRFIIISLFISCILMAAPVDLEKAQRVAGNIYAERSNTGTMDGFNLRSVNILDENTVNLVYVFQLEPQGFILARIEMFEQLLTENFPLLYQHRKWP